MASWPYFAGMFGPTNNLSNIFAPISALFVGISAVGLLVTIYLQNKAIQQAQTSTETQNFQNIYFKLRDEIIASRSKRNEKIAEVNKKSSQFYATKILHMRSQLTTKTSQHHNASINDVEFTKRNFPERDILAWKQEYFKRAISDAYINNSEVCSFIQKVVFVLKYIYSKSDNELSNNAISKEEYVDIIFDELSNDEIRCVFAYFKFCNSFEISEIYHMKLMNSKLVYNDFLSERATEFINEKLMPDE